MKVMNVIRRAFTEARTYATIAVAAFLSFQVVPDDVKVQATAAMVAIGTAVYLLAYYWGTVDATAETTKEWEKRYNADIDGLVKGYKERKAELEAELRGTRANLERQEEKNAELAERARQVANLVAERDAANDRVAELEAELAAATAEDARMMASLNPSERRLLWCVARDDGMEGRFAVLGFDDAIALGLARRGVIEKVDDNEVGTLYGVAPGWRAFAHSHMDELLETSDYFELTGQSRDGDENGYRLTVIGGVTASPGQPDPISLPVRPYGSLRQDGEA